MPIKRTLAVLSLIVACGGLLSARPCAAQNAFLHVTLDTSSLAPLYDPTDPYRFEADFQLIDGSGTLDAVNTVTVSNTQVSGGSLLSPANVVGDSVGDLNSTLTLKDDSSVINEFSQAFMPGSALSFDVAMTSNVDAGGIPDEFSFGILDDRGQLVTTGPANALLTVDFDGYLPTLQTYGADLTQTSIALNAPGAVFVPEPGTAALLLCGAGGWLSLCRRKRR